jgi:hypothetical protein
METVWTARHPMRWWQPSLANGISGASVRTIGLPYALNHEIVSLVKNERHMIENLNSFETLSVRTGIPLPKLLRELIAAGKTTYGPDWQTTYRERMANDPPAMISVYDFEWIDAKQAENDIAEWLNPDAQSGRVFLPFASSGAGDAFCLMPFQTPNGTTQIGVAMIWHDDDASEIGYASFEDFVCTKLIETMSDFEHLLNEECTAEQAAVKVRTDLASVTALMDAEHRSFLCALADKPLMMREHRRGTRGKPHWVPSLIGQAEMEAAFANFPDPNQAAFTVVPRWEVGDAQAAILPRYTAMLTDCGENAKRVLVALKQLSAFASLSSAELLSKQHQLPLTIVTDTPDPTKAEKTANVFRALGASVSVTKRMPGS